MLFSLTGRSSTAACLCTISTNRSNGYSRFRAAMVAWHSGPQAAIVHPARCCGWDRIGEVLGALCDQNGQPVVKLHGLRMLSPAIISSVPLASADSTAICRNVNLDMKWRGSYAPATRLGRALALRERIENVIAASRWSGPQPTETPFRQAELFPSF